MLKPLDSAKKRGRDRKFRQSQRDMRSDTFQNQEPLEGASAAEVPNVRRDEARQAWRHKITSQIKGFGFFFFSQTMRSYPKALNQEVA